MMKKIIIEVDGVRHKMVRTKTPNCHNCSLSKVCNNTDWYPCKGSNTQFKLCKKGE